MAEKEQKTILNLPLDSLNVREYHKKWKIKKY